jgi:hypothetical protein
MTTTGGTQTVIGHHLLQNRQMDFSAKQAARPRPRRSHFWAVFPKDAPTQNGFPQTLINFVVNGLSAVHWNEVYVDAVDDDRGRDYCWVL